jgi:hypothetical protein
MMMSQRPDMEEGEPEQENPTSEQKGRKLKKS